MKDGLLRIIYLITVVTLLGACASMGRPIGGERDEVPPVFVRSNPEPGALNFNGNRLNIFFDENIKMEDVINKVVVSPVQKQQPMITANGHRLSVQFRDSLRDNTTYTVDFSDAIRDLNEGNILDGFAFDFSTGATRDSLVISGMVFEARTLEPAQGMLVGAYSNLADTAISTLPFDRITKTNQYGQFVLRNLAPGAYNIYALNDLNRDYHWDRSEDVAFLGQTVVPEVVNITVTDTLRASNGLDSITTRAGYRYLPNDILLTWFNENYRSQYLKTNSRIDSTRVFIELGAPTDTLPQLTLLNTPAAGRLLDEVARLDYSARGDSITYWITDKSVISSDTLMLAARYLRTDTLDQLSWTTDTLRLTNRDKAKFLKELDKKNKEREKILKKLQEEGKDTVFTDAPVFMTFQSGKSNSQELNKPIYFTASQPVDTIYADKIHLAIKVDTIWRDLGMQHLVRDSLNRQLLYTLRHDWNEGAQYKLTVDSAAVIGIYGNVNNAASREFTVKNLNDYSTIRLHLTGVPDQAQMIVELLNSQDKPVAAVPLTDGVATFTFVSPDDYYVRAYIDANANGEWDTGSVKEQRQPEEVYYMPKKLSLKRNWDIDQQWDINLLPVDAQKPAAIKKNKPKTRDGKPNGNKNDDEEEDDDYYTGSGNGYKSNSGINQGMITGGGGQRYDAGTLRR